MTEISIVIPVYQGAKFLPDLIARIFKLKEILEAKSAEITVTECICVDDDSKDGSLRLLQELSEKHGWLEVITLAKNSGQHAATVAGIAHTSGDWVVTLDEDLQHDPKWIPRMLLRALAETSDVIYGVAGDGAPHSILRNAASKGIKILVEKMAGVMNARKFNSYRLIRGEVARSAAAGYGRNQYLDISLSWFTSNVGVVALEMKDRRTLDGEKSTYSIPRLIRHAQHLVLSSDLKIIHYGAVLGFSGAFLGFSFLAILLAVKLLFPEYASDARGWASTTAILLMFNGMIMLQAGVSLRILSTIFQRSQGRPPYFVISRGGPRSLENWLREKVAEIESELPA